MKLEKIEHNHKLTNILKVVLFAILMIMPFISALSKMTYISFNKNAKDSYYGETINERILNNIDSTDDLKINYNYELNIPTNTLNINVDTSQLFISNINNFNSTYGSASTLQIDTIYAILIAYNTDAQVNVLTLYREGLNNLYVNLNSYSISFDFTLDRYNTLNNWNNFTSVIYSINYNKYSYLDNVFYYANNQVWEEDIFSWVNTGLFANSLGAFIGVFGIAQNSYFNNLLTYWLVLIIIYIIIDLILGLFTLITHIICNKKVKE